MSEAACNVAEAPGDVPRDDSPSEESLRLAEALIFASGAPVTPRALAQILPEDADADAVLSGLRARYAGRGVELVEAGGGYQFRTSLDLAPKLRRVIQSPRRLARVAMETLAIIAYHQPVTRAEIEERRGASLSQQTLDALLEAGLVTPKGRKEAPGRPTLWATAPGFLAQFGLRDLRDLPRREDLLTEAATAVTMAQAPAEPAPGVPSDPEAEPMDEVASEPEAEPSAEGTLEPESKPAAEEVTGAGGQAPPEQAA